MIAFVTEIGLKLCAFVLGWFSNGDAHPCLLCCFCHYGSGTDRDVVTTATERAALIYSLDTGAARCG